ncbi:unnamed protein product [Triticum turgidum subsp. durum]|uniref:Wall-associated receptor kinase galacturonan-binding domain-containing protein n=1 Tax=Triticum turgidum subsp. durum TaxID=4567 RepID=A0A9R1RDY1_TRITD|nr:unnamed protein product [Triticum turgidum subsp. durum]
MAFLVLLIVASFAASATAALEAEPACSPSLCGAVEVRYPFWLDGGGGGNVCGYPSLRLECRGGTPVLRLPSGDYRVHRISYGDNGDDGTFTLHDSIVHNSRCPLVVGRNLTLPEGSPPPFSLTGNDMNVTFYLRCPFNASPSHMVACLEEADGVHHTYAFRDGDYLLPYEFNSLCQDVVGMPVLRSSLGGSRWIYRVFRALWRGFELRWTRALEGRCRDCENSGGLCGHLGEAPDQFTCFTAPAAPAPALLLSL